MPLDVAAASSHEAEIRGPLSAADATIVMLLALLLRSSTNPALLGVFSEQYSVFDEEMNAAMQRVLRDEFDKCTVIAVAHRIDTICPGSDVVVVVVGDGGRAGGGGGSARGAGARRHFAQLVRDTSH
ncbi:hypothetical protein NHJ13734_008905 [Beauveria thailandica]